MPEDSLPLMGALAGHSPPTGGTAPPPPALAEADADADELAGADARRGPPAPGRHGPTPPGARRGGRRRGRTRGRGSRRRFLGCGPAVSPTAGRSPAGNAVPARAQAGRRPRRAVTPR